MSLSEHLSKRMSQGMEQDPGSPEIVSELLDATSEWKGIADIVKLTFKGVYHVLKVHGDCIREMEHVLPAKANKQDLA